MDIVDVLGQIARYCPPQTLWQLKRVNSRFRRATDTVTERWCFPFIFRCPEGSRLGAPCQGKSILSFGYIIFNTLEVIEVDITPALQQLPTFLLPPLENILKLLFQAAEPYHVRPFFISANGYDSRIFRSDNIGTLITALKDNFSHEFPFSQEGERMVDLVYPDPELPNFYFPLAWSRVNAAIQKFSGHRQLPDVELPAAVMRYLFLRDVLKARLPSRMSDGSVLSQQKEDADHFVLTLDSLATVLNPPFEEFWRIVHTRDVEFQQREESAKATAGYISDLMGMSPSHSFDNFAPNETTERLQEKHPVGPDQVTGRLSEAKLVRSFAALIAFWAFKPQAVMEKPFPTFNMKRREQGKPFKWAKPRRLPFAVYNPDTAMAPKHFHQCLPQGQDYLLNVGCDRFGRRAMLSLTDFTSHKMDPGLLSRFYVDDDEIFRLIDPSLTPLLRMPTPIIRAEPWRASRSLESIDPLELIDPWQGNVEEDDDPKPCQYPRLIWSRKEGNHCRPYQCEYHQWFHVLQGSVIFMLFRDGRWSSAGEVPRGTTVFIPPMTPMLWVHYGHQSGKELAIITRKFVDGYQTRSDQRITK